MHLRAPGGKESASDRAQLRVTLLTILDDLPRLNGDVKRPVVEVENGELSAAERGEKINVNLREEIVTLPLEVLVRLLLKNDDNIARDGAGCLVRLAGEGDLLAGLHAAVDVDLEHLPLRDHLLPLALLAPVLRVDDLTRGVAVAAGLLDLRG